MWESFNQYAQKREIIRLISEKTGVPATYVFIALLVVVFLMLFKGICGTLIILFLCFMYPAYLTFKAIKYEQKDTLFRWGKYWVVISFLVFLSQVADFLLSGLPFFGLIESVCAYLLVKAEGSGAVYMYDNVVVPLVTKYESYIDSKLTYIESAVEKEKTEIAHMGEKAKEAAVGAAVGAFAQGKEKTN